LRPHTATMRCRQPRCFGTPFRRHQLQAGRVFVNGTCNL
jgi:hypothetical protein